jgi:DNA polymerase III subunit delta'
VRFRDVIGQEILKKSLLNAVLEDKVSHAQLFSGKAGYGTLPLALAYSQFLFCENKKADDSCGECLSCIKVEKLQHPDLHFVFPVVPQEKNSKQATSDDFIDDWREQISSNPYFNLGDWTKKIDVKERNALIRTEESKEILRKLSLKSFEGGYKIMLLWNPEEMNATCSNKLLKILEEPPPRTLFLLVSDNPDKLLLTIQSRIQKICVPKIESQILSFFLQEKKMLTAIQADSLASLSEGDLIKVQEFLDADIFQSIYVDFFMQLMRVCYKKDVLAMMDWSEKISIEGKETQKLFLIYALHMFRQSIMSNYIGESMMRVSEEEKVFLDKFAPFISGNNIREFIRTFDDAHYNLERNANSKILFTQLCFQVMRFIHQA